jgi:hypothetical protein
MRSLLEQPEAGTDHHEAEAPFGADLVDVRSLGAQASTASEGDIETDSDDNSHPGISSMLVPASGTRKDVVPHARVKQEAAAEPEPGCVLGRSNERSRNKDRFKVPAPAHCSLELAAELEGGPDSFTEPEQQGGTDTPMAASTTAADSVGEPRRAQTDFEIGSPASTQALARQPMDRYQCQQKEQPTHHLRVLSRYTRTR